jgi:hypothetical protein
VGAVIKILGIDLGKNWFHVIGIDEVGRTILPQEVQLRAVTGASGYDKVLVGCHGVLCIDPAVSAHFMPLMRRP